MFRPIIVAPLFASMSEADSGATIDPLRVLVQETGCYIGSIVLAAAFTRTMMTRE